MSFRDVKTGDTVRRMLAGEIPQDLHVTDVTEDRIVCTWWEFDRDTGHEIDEDISTLVSFLVEPEPKP